MKVFEVKVVTFGYVVAEEQKDVSRYVRELCDGEESEIDIKEVTRFDDLRWDRGAIPYGDNKGDLTLGELLMPAVKLKISVPGWVEEEVRTLLTQKGVTIE